MSLPLARRSMRFDSAGLLLVMTLAWLPSLARAGDSALDEAVRSRDSQAISRRFSELVRDDPKLAAEVIPAAYSAIESLPDEAMYAGDRYRVFASATNTLARIELTAAVKILEKTVRSSKDWREQFIVLHAARQNSAMDAVGLAMKALEAKDPRVVQLAARILGRSRDVQVLDAVLSAMQKWEKREVIEKLDAGREKLEVDLGARAWLACRDALHRLTGKAFHFAQDFKNYIRAHREDIDPKKVDIENQTKDERATRVNLFGLEVTGKNIMFILDISGSMETTDPFTPEQLAELNRPGRTVVKDAKDPLVDEFLQDRKRIRRAKRELLAVVRSLPEDKNFNVILYSNEANAWKEWLVDASEKNKNAFAEHAETIKAHGVTFTDDALRRALDDPSVDTIYLITDGAPTHMGSQGKAMPPDAPQLIQTILQETKYRNYLRQVRIFTLGFEGAEEDFLKQLSKENEGIYTRIE